MNIYMQYKQNYDDVITVRKRVVVPYNAIDFIKYRKDIGTQEDIVDLFCLTDQSVVSAWETLNADMDDRLYTLFLLASNNHPKGYYLVNRKNPDHENRVLTFDKYEEPLFIEIPTDDDKPRQLYTPDGNEVKALRAETKLNQEDFADLFVKKHRQYISNAENNVITIGGRAWMLLLLITNRHPYYKLVKDDE